MEYTLITKSKTKIIFLNSQTNNHDEVIKNYFEQIINMNRKVLLLSEEKIFKKYQNYLENNLLKPSPDKFDYHTFFVMEGDFLKNEETVSKIISFMLEKSFDKASCILAFGGGKITDLAGYISSIYQRGIDCLLIPTTLLSIVDASIGGKTGINDLKYGKNLVGTVYQPIFVLINLWILDELEEELISDGMSEIIKMFAMFDKDLFYSLLKHNVQSLRLPENKEYFHHLCKKAIEYKVRVVEQDDKDKGIRNLLNFGHTIGHAIESVEALNISHGKSVAVGLCVETEIAASLGYTSEATCREIKEVLENFGLETEIPKYIDPFNLVQKMKNDKKNSQNKLKIVVIKKIGELYDNYTISLDFELVTKYISRTVFIEPLSKESKETIRNSSSIKKIKLKGSKSICNRALILSALGKGEILLNNFLFSEDTSVMIKCLKNMGVKIEIIDNTTVKVFGKNGEFSDINTTLYIENAGTAARFLTTLCTISTHSRFVIDGNSRMRERPIEDLLDVLSSCKNIKIEFLENKNKLPFVITTGNLPLNGGELFIKSNKSSQFVSSLLLSAPFFNQNETIIHLTDVNIGELPTSYQYLEMTIKMMKKWGIDVKTENYNKFIVNSGSYTNRINYLIEPDASTANFYLSFFALHGGSVEIEGIGSNSIQGDSKFAFYLCKIAPNLFEYQESADSIIFRSDFSRTNCFRSEIKFDENVSIITDSFLALGVVCSQIPGEYTLRGLANQAIKESNRLELFALNLNKLGIFCSILSDGDGISINSKEYVKRVNNLNFVEIKTADDHRMAMSFAILASYLENTRVYIDNKNCVNKTYPEFWRDFEKHFGMQISTELFDSGLSIYKLYRENYRNNPVFLIGMRSCGKSTFGKYSAERLDLRFVDFDDLLIKKNKEFSCIQEIIEKNGWQYFRQMERNLFYEIFQNKNFEYDATVIACGGGIVENEEILQCLKSYQLVIFIDMHIENIKQILNLNLKENNRPRFSTDIDSVYYSRLEKYKYCSTFTFKVPYLEEEQITVKYFDKIKENLCDLFTQFLYSTCCPMKYPLPDEPSYFLSILAHDEEELNDIFLNKKLLAIENFSTMYNAVEFRADGLINYFLNSLNISKEEILEKIVNALTSLRFNLPYAYTPIIFTIRTTNDGGLYKLDKNNKLYNYLLNQIRRFGIEYFDIEYSPCNIGFIEEFYKDSKAYGNYRVILSKHYTNYDNCDIGMIKKDIYTMSILASDVVKIITSIKDRESYEEIKRFIKKFIKKPLIHFQLGAENKLTRAYNMFLNPVYNERISTPSGKGQLTYAEVLNMRKITGIDNNYIERAYYVVGNPVTSSPSPFIYETGYINAMQYSQCDNKYSFDRKNLQSESEFFEFVFNKNHTPFASFISVTIPYKEKLFDYYDESDSLCIGEEAKFIKSINLIKKMNDSSKLFCHNTDWIANYEIIIEIFKQIGKNLDEIKILILGAGGASVATMMSLLLINIKRENIYVKNRTYEKSNKLRKRFGINIWEFNSTTKIAFDIVISAVPRNTDELFFEELLENTNISENTFLLDLAYTTNQDEKTNYWHILSKVVNAAKYIDGLEFLLRQAYYSYEIFFGKIAPRRYLKEKLMSYMNK